MLLYDKSKWVEGALMSTIQGRLDIALSIVLKKIGLGPRQLYLMQMQCSRKSGIQVPPMAYTKGLDSK